MNAPVTTLLNDSLEKLCDFQRATVDSVIGRFEQVSHSKRVLVADEVGLGKTRVAEGVIVKLLQRHLSSGRTDPLRVTYICSNLALADSNIKKLRVFNSAADRNRYLQQPSYRRLLEVAMPLTQQAQAGKLLEICTLTPAVSFTLTNGHGNATERAIMVNLLSQHPRAAEPWITSSLAKLFQGESISSDNWQYEMERVAQLRTAQPVVLAKFLQRLEGICDDERLSSEDESWMAVISRCALAKKGAISTLQQRLLRIHCRRMLAQSCAASLQADLFILDEFQRFDDLLGVNEESESSLIASEVFRQKNDACILLLSATPFKAMTSIDEQNNDDTHLAALTRLLTFLQGERMTLVQDYHQARLALHQQLLNFGQRRQEVNLLDSSPRQRVENLLRQVICRTERNQLIPDFKRLYHTPAVDTLSCMSREEVQAWCEMVTVAAALKESYGDNSALRTPLLELSKSSPWLLSFAHGYSFYQNLKDKRQPKAVRSALKAAQHAWLDQSGLNRYRLSMADDAPHALLRAVTPVVFAGGGERLLWVPPARPWYPFSGSWQGCEGFSKTLLFSAWSVVPRMLSALWSYEAERRLLLKVKKKPDYWSEKTHVSPLRLEAKSSLTGWGLLYPARYPDQLTPFTTADSLDAMLNARLPAIDAMLDNFTHLETPAGSGLDWYILAPLLIDRHLGFGDWIEAWLDNAAGEADAEGRQASLQRVRLLLEGKRKPGVMPDDLARYLALNGLASPATCALRSLKHLRPDAADLALLKPTLIIAEGLMGMFNHSYASKVLNATTEKKQPWLLRVLTYCAEGNLQAMLDEYLHLLQQNEGSAEQALISDESDAVSRMLSDAATVNLSHLDVNFYPGGKPDSKRMHCHYALALSEKISSDEKVKRTISVRDAFNSPFRPFVLSSTSVGQEGLDFHWYCHRVIHWNLPSNPIDIEQREGRVNRYKSFTIRKRIAEHINGSAPAGCDPWHWLFSQAEQVAKQQGLNDLAPYWFYPFGETRIERLFPAMPMSRDVERRDRYLRILALYRLTFGQPQQEELLDILLKCQLTEAEERLVLERLAIGLAPYQLGQLRDESAA